MWEDTLQSTQSDLLDTLIIGINEKLLWFEQMFWDGVAEIEKNTDLDELVDWFVKVIIYLEKNERTLIKRKKQKLKKLLCYDEEKMVAALSRFEEHLTFYNFTAELISHCEILSPDISNLTNLVQIGSITNENCNVRLEQVEEKSVGDIISEDKNRIDFSNIETSANRVDGRFEGKFVSPNVVNLSDRKLSKAEISLLSKGLKFVPTPSNVNRAVLKEELEVFGRRLRLLWCFRNEDNNASYNPFRPKSTFNPRGKDVAIELYLSRLEEEILAIDTELSYSNLTREEWNALKSLRNDASIIIKGADKGSAVIVWDREDYLKEAES